MDDVHPLLAREEDLLVSRSQWARGQVLVPLASAVAVIMLCLAGVSKPLQTSQQTSQGLRSVTSLSTGWVQKVGLNCYEGHGGVKDTSMAEPGVMNLAECMQTCTSSSSCSAIVFLSAPERGPCYVLSQMVEKECVPGGVWNTWLQSSSGQPAPPPPPTLAPAPPAAAVPPTPETPVQSHAPAVVTDEAEVRSFPDTDDPNWGCGLLGHLPGITEGGHSVTPEMQRVIDVLKKTSTFDKVSYWNWNLAPMTDEAKGAKSPEVLSAQFLFMPEQWGANTVEDKYLRKAGAVNFLDSDGQVCLAQMANILLGSNEPDIRGSCMGNMFGKCVSPCDDASTASGDCPAAKLWPVDPPGTPNSKGQCNCWQFSHATGVGFWQLAGCSGLQPLMSVWEDPTCTDTVMGYWKGTASLAVAKGYKYLSTPLVAEHVDYAEKFIEHACDCQGGSCSCTDASCGCPVYVGFHFYAYDCQPESSGGYETLQSRLKAVAGIMEKYPFVKGAIINEVGMLNCAPESKDPICVPNSGKYPASATSDHACPSTDELPNGLASFIDKIFDYIISAKTKDGREVVKGFSWFNQDQDGGTYNLRLFNNDGTVNKAGEAYMAACTRWRR